ncbi:MAG: NUDIX hydrolase [Planctomycetes bacterium]|nr:NUDIX hydrolase [Planctomycetota bacterium]
MTHAPHGPDPDTAHFDAEGRPRPWPRRGSRHGEPLVLFRPRWDLLQNPRNGREFERLVLETPDWVNVVALTPRRELVLVEQYRFGTGTVTLEIPGGVIDLGEPHEHAARRELAEETGHTGGTWTYLGAVEPNPAFQTNVCHHWLAEGVERTGRQGLDAGEDIAIRTLPLEAALRAVREGLIRHALVVTALARVADLRVAHLAPGGG